MTDPREQVVEALAFIDAMDYGGLSFEEDAWAAKAVADAYRNSRARIASLEATLRMVADNLHRHGHLPGVRAFTPQGWAELMKHRTPAVPPTGEVKP